MSKIFTSWSTLILLKLVEILLQCLVFLGLVTPPEGDILYLRLKQKWKRNQQFKNNVVVNVSTPEGKQSSELSDTIHLSNTSTTSTNTIYVTSSGKRLRPDRAHFGLVDSDNEEENQEMNIEKGSQIKSNNNNGTVSTTSFMNTNVRHVSFTDINNNKYNSSDHLISPYRMDIGTPSSINETSAMSISYYDHVDMLSTTKSSTIINNTRQNSHDNEDDDDELLFKTTMNADDNIEKINKNKTKDLFVISPICSQESPHRQQIDQIMTQITNKTLKYEESHQKSTSISTKNNNTLLNKDIDQYYEQLFLSEKRHKEQSLHESTVKQLTNQLATLLHYDQTIDIQAIEELLSLCKDKINIDLYNQGMKMYTEVQVFLNKLLDVKQLFQRNGKKTEELLLTEMLDSELGRRLRLHSDCIDIKEYLFLHPAIEEIIETEQIDDKSSLLFQQQPSTTNTTTVTPTTIASIIFDFDYIKRHDARIQWYKRLEMTFHTVQLPNEAQIAVQNTLSQLNEISTQQQVETQQKVSIALHIIGNISALFKNFNDLLDSNSVVFIISTILKEIMELIVTQNLENHTFIYAFIIQGAYFCLGKNLKNVFSSILRPILDLFCRFSIPDFSLPFHESSFESVRCFAILIETESINDFYPKYAFEWLIHACQQLYVLHSAELNILLKCCSMIHLFLVYCQGCLYRNYTTAFRKLMNDLSQLLTSISGDESTQLQTLIQPIITDNNAKENVTIIISKTLHNYPAHILRNKLFIGSLQKFIEDAMKIENIHSTEMRQKLQYIGLDGLEGEFNKLGPTKDSQDRVIHGIINIANRAGNDISLVNFTLYRVATEIVHRSTSQFFTISSGHALPLARIICLLCHVKKDIGDLIKSQFYMICPLTVPYFGEDLQGNTYYKEMGYERITDKHGNEGWETGEKWIQKQMKVIVTYFTIAIQNEQDPLSLQDVMNWFIHIINMVKNSQKLPPFMIANVLDNVLRTVSPVVFQKYGRLFIDILKVIKEQIMPLLDTKAPKSKIELKRLEQFLHAAIKSNGKEFLPLY